jgi:hypothetical protein
VDRASAWSRLNRMRWEMATLSSGKLDNATALGMEKTPTSALCGQAMCSTHFSYITAMSYTLTISSNQKFALQHKFNSDIPYPMNEACKNSLIRVTKARNPLRSHLEITQLNTHRERSCSSLNSTSAHTRCYEFPRRIGVYRSCRHTYKYNVHRARVESPHASMRYSAMRAQDTVKMPNKEKKTKDQRQSAAPGIRYSVPRRVT